MKRFALIALVILILLLVAVVAIFLLKGKPTPTTSTNPNSPGFPIASSTTGGTNGTAANSFNLPGQNGAIIATKDFLHNGQTIEDQQNRGNYYLAGSVGYCNADGTCPSGAPSTEYNIVYYSDSQTFIIALTSEPIAQARLDAQSFMMKTLGISQSQMCNLNYQVLTTVSVNGQYAGQNLGFSFCPGATQLPS